MSRMLRTLNCSAAAAIVAVSLVALIGSTLDAQVTGPAYEAADAEATGNDTSAPAATLRFDVVVGSLDQRIDRLINQMTLEEKIGQLVQIYPSEDKLLPKLAEQVRGGGVGSLFYPGNRAVVEEAQRIAVEESRLGIPLLIARDVIHGFRTIFPIPLGQAATWNPQLIERAARISADEARSEKIDWTFAPMVDICRDARWGRIAETLGEDPMLAGSLASAMVRGFQQEEAGKIGGVLACAKHFVGYGMSEGGRDYNRVSVSRGDLHNVLLPPFRSTVDSGCRTFMTTFSEVNGLPGTAHAPLIEGVLRRDWGYRGMVVSDWGSITEMITHGFAKDKADAAELALEAGVDMDMCSPAFAGNLKQLIADGRVSVQRIDEAVRRVLRCKAELAGRDAQPTGQLLRAASLEAAREAVRQSIVLLKNDDTLPLSVDGLKRVAVVGPMADAPQQQLGCWSLDGKPGDSVTPLAHLRERLEGAAEVVYAAGAKNTFDDDDSQVAAAAEAAAGADVALVFIGEDATLSGEARCRATLTLPGVQPQIIKAVAETGTPTIVVLLAGRPLNLQETLEQSGAVLFAWHPGTMAGPAIGDLLFGEASPSGKLPVTFPRSVGQTPIYYGHPNTGRPSPATFRPLVGSGEDDLPGEFQYRSHYLDEELGPEFPFGFGLSYTTFNYSEAKIADREVRPGGELEIAATVTNSGDVAAAEVVQLYIRDLTARRVRPIRELKGFQRVPLAPGESREVTFRVPAQELGYRDASGRLVIEPGEYLAGIGGDSTVELSQAFRLMPADQVLAPTMPDPIPTAATGDSPVR